MPMACLPAVEPSLSYVPSCHHWLNVLPVPLTTGAGPWYHGDPRALPELTYLRPLSGRPAVVEASP